jgi:DNA-binding NtrC family response regulator
MPTSDAVTTPDLRPSAALPLAGLTILAVEDSRFASEALRLMCQASGACLKRAETLAAARRHLGTYRPDLVIADQGLPDGNGLDLIALAHPICPVIVCSGDSDPGPAMAAGANAFLEKPIPSLAQFQKIIQDTVRLTSRVTTYCKSDRSPLPDPITLSDDLRRAEAALGNDHDLIKIAQFLDSLAETAHRPGLHQIAGALRQGQSKTTVRAMLRRWSNLDAEICGDAGKV